MGESTHTVKILLTLSFGVGLGALVSALAALVTAEGSSSPEVRRGWAASFFTLIPVALGFKPSARFRRDEAGLFRRGLFAEFFCAVFCVLFIWRFNSPLPILFSFTALAFLLFHSLTDIENGHIYDLPVLVMLAAGFFLRLWGGAAALVDGGLGAAVGFALIFAIRLISRGAVGTGDAMLMLGAGALLGWRLTLAAVYGGFIIGGFFVIPLLFMGKINAKDAVPFAPFLAAGSLLSLLMGGRVCSLVGQSLAWPWLT